MNYLKLLICSLLLASYGGLIQGQSGLQVEFERGYPLREDFIKDSKAENLHLAFTPTIGPLDDQSKPWRLPRTVMPVEYDLTITPVLDEPGPGVPGAAFTAPGEVSIGINVINATNQITMHMANTNYITLHTWEVIDTQTGTPLPKHNDTQDPEHQFLTLNLVDPLLVGSGRYRIEMTFTSIIIAGLDGLYRGTYVDPYTNTTKYIATTQMEALHARQMFPCFDEPAFKAVFHITIGRRSDHVALTTTTSNRVTNMAGFPGWVWEEFVSTQIRMPTYLLALIVSEFTFEQADSSLYSKVVRTYAPKHFIDQMGGVYAAEKAALLLKYFETYYVEQYPLGKMDSAAVPNFFFGAMENYGLNIYRENALLYMPSESTEDERFRITRILAHELGHQWFGNAISPMWWTHIWLNEGFATYLAAQGAHEVGPEFQAWERYQNDAVQNSMAFDARSDYSHSVKIDETAWGTREAMSWFDRMAYEKAGSLILMMNAFLGEDTLRKGLLTYLNRLQFQAAVQDDLFEHLTTASVADNKLPDGLTVKRVMDTWTLQPGFPLIRVSVANASGVFISQERFLNNHLQVPVLNHIDQDTGLWFVPMAIATGSEPNPNATVTEWLYNDVAMKYFSANHSQWVVVNAGANGFYRVLYDTVLTQSIKNQLMTNHNFISSRTRSQLLDDYFTSAWQKHINIETALSLAEYIGREQEIVVWNTVLTNLRKPFDLLSGSTGNFYGSLRSFLLPRLQSAVNLTGGVANAALPEQFGGMPVLRHLQFMDWLCALEDPACVAYSNGLVNAWIANPSTNNIRRDVKPVAYCAAVANGGEATFDFIHSQYILSTNTLKQQGSLLNALACTKEIPLINRLLEQTLIDAPGFYNSSTHFTTIMTQLARNPLARGPMVRFLRENAVTAEIISRLGVTTVLSSLATYTSTQTGLMDIESYIAAVAVGIPTFPATTANVVATIRQNIEWVADFAAPMSAYFG